MRSVAARWLALALIFAALIGFLFLRRQASLPYLDSGPGEWIVAPLHPQAEARVAGTLEATFEVRFDLDTSTEPDYGRAELRARLFEDGEILLNGQPIGDVREVGRSDSTSSKSTSPNWKKTRRVRVGSLLQPGTNLLQVTVRRSAGPPALSLDLRAGSRRLATTGDHWTVTLVGSTPVPVQLATARPRQGPARIRPGVVDPAARRVATALGASLPAMLLVALVVALLGTGAYLLQHRIQVPDRLAALGRRKEPWIWTLVLSALWLGLYLNNAAQLPLTMGFDARGHLEYLALLVREGRLPLAEEGWQMYQPPLFYALAALPLDMLGWNVDTTANSSAVTYLVRALTFAAGLAQMLLIYATARRLWPAEPTRQRLALLIAAGLPVHLYLFHYASNETWATALSAAVVWATVSWFRSQHTSTRAALIGFLLGLALLAKVTALLLLVAVVATLVLAPMWRRASPSQPATSTRLAGLRPALIVLGVALLVGGWHYGRAALEYGNPLIGNWDPSLGFDWWQDPGYRTLHDLADLPTLGLGTVLDRPWFAGFAGTGAGLTSTLFGDALAGGEAEVRLGPPWNHTWMAAGYAFAPLILLLALGGLVIALRDLAQARRSAQEAAAWIFLLSTGALVAAALIYMSLAVPSYAQAKAFYGQPALPLFVLLAALGADTALRHLRAPTIRIALIGLLLLWTSWSWTTIWIRTHAPETQVMQGLQALQSGNSEYASRLFEAALETRPDLAEAHLGRYWVAMERGDLGSAKAAAQAALEHAPDHPEALMASARSQAREPQQAERWLRRAIDLAPGDDRGPALLVDLLLQQGRLQEAKTILRQQLLASPGDAEIHLRLVTLYGAENDLEAARRQILWWADVRPDDPRATQALDLLNQGVNRTSPPPGAP